MLSTDSFFSNIFIWVVEITTVELQDMVNWLYMHFIQILNLKEESVLLSAKHISPCIGGKFEKQNFEFLASSGTFIFPHISIHFTVLLKLRVYPLNLNTLYSIQHSFTTHIQDSFRRCHFHFVEETMKVNWFSPHCNFWVA